MITRVQSVKPMNVLESGLSSFVRSAANRAARRISAWLRPARAEVRYLASSTDLAELERRLQQLERNRPSFML